MKAKVMPDGRLSLPAELRKKHGLAQGGEVIVEDIGDAIVLRTLDQVVARAQALSRKLVAGKPGARLTTFSPIGRVWRRVRDVCCSRCLRIAGHAPGRASRG